MAALLAKKYGTNNPIEIAQSMGIQVIWEDLGSIHGYYCKYLRIKQIHINSQLPEQLKVFTGAHELGHAIFHPNVSTPFLKAHTYQCVDMLEIEANKFALELLIPDSEILDYACNYTIEQIARIYGYHEKLIELRLK